VTDPTKLGLDDVRLQDACSTFVDEILVGNNVSEAHTRLESNLKAHGFTKKGEGRSWFGGFGSTPSDAGIGSGFMSGVRTFLPALGNSVLKMGVETIAKQLMSNIGGTGS
jgi:hypothetical protein